MIRRRLLEGQLLRTAGAGRGVDKETNSRKTRIDGYWGLLAPPPPLHQPIRLFGIVI
jgi:hypothetical protein